MSAYAPQHNPGQAQVVPDRGPHDQIYVNEMQLMSLLLLQLVYYEPEYGPNAKVYRPTQPADTETIQGWLRFGGG